jgi:uncharacterized protein (DUF58 family)
MRMRAEPVVGVALVLFGAYAHIPVAILLGIVLLFLEGVREVWSRKGLSGVEYRRLLPRRSTNWGEPLPLTIEIWNRKRLPLGWIRAHDEASLGVEVTERGLSAAKGGMALANTWALAPFERVTREFHVGADRRGVFELGPVELSVADILGQEAAVRTDSTTDRFVVWPRTVPAMPLDRRDRWGGLGRSRVALNEDPSRFTGIREYVPGDPVRRIHTRASARLGRPVVKRFEPSRDREFLIALDVQTRPGDVWRVNQDVEELEDMVVVAASVARSLAVEHAGVGLAAAAFSGTRSGFAYLPVSAGPGQLERVLDLLARLSTRPSGTFERVMSLVARALAPGTTVIVITCRDPRDFVGHLRGLERHGCPVVVLATGGRAREAVGTARSAGLVARVATLGAPWRTARQLIVAP